MLENRTWPCILTDGNDRKTDSDQALGIPLFSLLDTAIKTLTKSLCFIVTVGRVGRGRIKKEKYKAQRRLMAGLGSADPLVFDAGRHNGETIEKYKKTFPRCRIVSFEATPHSFETLRNEWENKRALPEFLSVSSENLQKALHPIQIDTTHFRFEFRRCPGLQIQNRSVNWTPMIFEHRNTSENNCYTR